MLHSDVHILFDHVMYMQWHFLSCTPANQSSMLYFSSLCACVSIPSTASPSAEKRGRVNGKQFFSVSTDVAIL